LKTKPIISLFPALAFVILLWVIYYAGVALELHLHKYGILPRTIEGLKGIVFYPLIHGSLEHLFSNTIPLLMLGWCLFYFYGNLALKTIFWIYLMSGMWIWISARDSYHIGASGLVYGLVTFLFFSGWYRKEKKVAAISMLVIFLYGSLWWGMLPVKKDVSFEGHIWGALAGFLLAFIFRKQGPQKPVYVWEDEEMENLNPLHDEVKKEDEIKISYIYNEKNQNSII
jgi:membrane associated rhomboid family serine protease